MAKEIGYAEVWIVWKPAKVKKKSIELDSMIDETPNLQFGSVWQTEPPFGELMGMGEHKLLGVVHDHAVKKGAVDLRSRSVGVVEAPLATDQLQVFRLPSLQLHQVHGVAFGQLPVRDHARVALPEPGVLWTLHVRVVLPPNTAEQRLAR